MLFLEKLTRDPLWKADLREERGVSGCGCVPLRSQANPLRIGTGEGGTCTNILLACSLAQPLFFGVAAAPPDRSLALAIRASLGSFLRVSPIASQRSCRSRLPDPGFLQ